MVVLLVIAAFLAGDPGAAGLPFTATAFFVVGAAGGFLHGALVGVAGRPPEVELQRAFVGIEVAAFAAIPLVVACWIGAIWISMTAMAFNAGQTGMVLGAGAGWLLALGVGLWAAVEGLAGFRWALKRWPERRPGLPLVILTFALLLVVFVTRRPEIWFTDVRVSTLGAVILSLGATVWIALPLLGVTLHFLHRWRSGSPIWDQAADPRR